MNGFRLFFTVLALIITFPSQASTCSFDVEQMRAQILQYGSIHSEKCPLNYFGWGITQVTDVVQLNETSCFARCKYAYYTGSSGKDCTWLASDWGKSLACAY